MRATFFLAAAALLHTGCGSDGNGRASTHKVRFDVGGFVAYQGDPTVGLPGVAVTLSNSAGASFAAVTGSNGLWAISGVEPGIFAERYELAGYEPVTGAFAMEAFGENDVANPFVARPTVLLEESRLRATVLPFAIVLRDGEELFDGVGGHTLEYSLGDAEDIEVVLSMPATGDYAILDDMMSGDFVLAALDSSTMTTFNVIGLQIQDMNAGAGLTPTSGSPDWHRVRIYASAYTPIHGEAVTLQASAWFSTAP